MGGRLHGHFGGCREFVFVEADPETRTIRATRTVPAPPHQPGLFPLWLRELGINASTLFRKIKGQRNFRAEFSRAVAWDAVGALFVLFRCWLRAKASLHIEHHTLKMHAT
ncbi:MAG TPA: hypothetical protein VI136_06855 [Verrucomicrobiae bacterium]